jgi:acetoin utilization deacetylase AcuC-like enzyme
MVAIIYSDNFLKHETGSFHPECPARLTAIVQALKKAPWHDQLDWQSPTPLEQRDVLPAIQKLHTPTYIERVKAIAASGGGGLEPDTPISPQSYQVALLAVSAWLDGVDYVQKHQKPAFVVARPPGHHAISNRGMGFCLFSNAAIAAYYALTLPGIERVGILDWDVHHGNGTESLVEDNPHILYCSIHQSPAYPGTGREGDRGKHENILNIPMLPGSNFKDYQPIFENQILPFLAAFQPQLMIISAGYDANRADPLADINLEPADYGQFSHYLSSLTSHLLFGLEGGYDLDALALSVVETIAPLLSI